VVNLSASFMSAAQIEVRSHSCGLCGAILSPSSCDAAATSSNTTPFVYRVCTGAALADVDIARVDGVGGNDNTHVGQSIKPMPVAQPLPPLAELPAAAAAQGLIRAD